MEVEFLNRHRQFLRRALLVLLLVLVPQCTVAQPTGVDEYRAKAAFIYKFCKFVSWPKQNPQQRNEPFVFGVVDNRPLAKVLTQELAGKKIGGRSVEVREFARLHEADKACVVYCTAEDLRRLLTSRREKLQRQSILTVGDGKQFLNAGGMLELGVKANRLAFGVNLGASRRSGLEVDPNLLDLAERIIEE
ncbi:MAG: YfiR family protein [Limisphaerales bacterium]